MKECRSFLPVAVVLHDVEGRKVPRCRTPGDFPLPPPNTVASEAGGFGYLVWTERQVRLVSMPIRLVESHGDRTVMVYGWNSVVSCGNGITCMGLSDLIMSRSRSANR